MKEYFNIVCGEIRTKVLVRGSLQHICSERILTVSARSLRRIEKLANGPWYCAAPTPRSRIEFVISD